MGIENLNDKQHRVCQKHFAQEDVITHTNFFDSSGNIIATLPSKIPRLKKNAKPCFIQISAEEEAAIISRNSKNWDTDSSNKKKKKNNNNNNNNNNNETTSENDNASHGQEANTSTSNDEETNNESDTRHEEENLTRHEEENAASPEEESTEHETENNSVRNNFLNLCRSFKEVILPENCYLNFSTEKEHIALFEICIVESNERSNTMVKRSLNIHNNSEIHYSVGNKAIEPEWFNLKSKVENVNELELCFQQFFTMYVCEGIADLKDVDLVKEKISYTDSLGVLRHQRCRLLSANEKCNTCARVRKTISQKKLRMSKRNVGGTEAGGGGWDSSNPEAANQDSLHAWKRTVRAQRKAIYRAKSKIKKLKSEMDKIKTNIKNVNLNDLLENCVKNKIPDVQKVLIQEIVSLAKSKNQNGHRYNESWVTLCLLLHIRSPKEYRHMRNINLLPLPCERTIRKYLSLTRANRDT
ncbi:probable serine/threonine-protein kinase DDB_G0276181 isoform X2 [Ceratina calcarata]|nr:probable serine/threonine-protein kinase DDB_G0276181 isoform X2 [Ceratina calcarata]